MSNPNDTKTLRSLVEAANAIGESSDTKKTKIDPKLIKVPYDGKVVKGITRIEFLDRVYTKTLDPKKMGTFIVTFVDRKHDDRMYVTKEGLWKHFMQNYLDTGRLPNGRDVTPPGLGIGHHYLMVRVDGICWGGGGQGNRSHWSSAKIVEAYGPNRSIARVREAGLRADRIRSSEEARIKQRIAAGKSARGKVDLTKNFGISIWSATSFALMNASDAAKMDADWEKALMGVGTSRHDWQSKVDHYYKGFGKDQEKQRKAFGKVLDLYMKETETKLLAPHARKIADAYMASCIARGIDWRIVADPLYDLRTVLYPNGATNDREALSGVVERSLRDNHSHFIKQKRTGNISAYHRLGTNIVRWVIDNPT
jgi:hypothetical protein